MRGPDPIIRPKLSKRGKERIAREKIVKEIIERLRMILPIEDADYLIVELRARLTKIENRKWKTLTLTQRPFEIDQSEDMFYNQEDEF